MFSFIVNSWLSLWVKPKQKHYLQAKHKLNFRSTQQKKTIWSWRANHLIIVKPISYKKPSYNNNLKPLSTKITFSILQQHFCSLFINQKLYCTCHSSSSIYGHVHWFSGGGPCKASHGCQSCIFLANDNSSSA